MLIRLGRSSCVCLATFHGPEIKGRSAAIRAGMHLASGSDLIDPKKHAQESRRAAR
jgi:hypothetical protein